MDNKLADLFVHSFNPLLLITVSELLVQELLQTFNESKLPFIGKYYNINHSILTSKAFPYKSQNT